MSNTNLYLWLHISFVWPNEYRTTDIRNSAVNIVWITSKCHKTDTTNSTHSNGSRRNSVSICFDAGHALEMLRSDWFPLSMCDSVNFHTHVCLWFAMRTDASSKTRTIATRRPSVFGLCVTYNFQLPNIVTSNFRGVAWRYGEMRRGAAAEQLQPDQVCVRGDSVDHGYGCACLLYVWW